MLISRQFSSNVRRRRRRKNADCFLCLHVWRSRRLSQGGHSEFHEPRINHYCPIVQMRCDFGMLLTVWATVLPAILFLFLGQNRSASKIFGICDKKCVKRLRRFPLSVRMLTNLCFTRFHFQRVPFLLFTNWKMWTVVCGTSCMHLPECLPMYFTLICRPYWVTDQN